MHLARDRADIIVRVGLIVKVFLQANGIAIATKDEPNADDYASTPNYIRDQCSLFLGPSPIKEAEQHGFGLGMFTGIDIVEGTTLTPEEVLLPIYDSATLDYNHPPLREYVWGGGEIPELSLGSSDRNALWFSPGLAGIAPCTTTNFNLQLSGAGVYAGVSRHNVAEDEDAPSRTSPLAGSYSYRHSLSYVAVRDIAAGEELVAECTDDDFDGSSHQMTRFDTDDTRYICLDNVTPYKYQSDSSIGGKGLMARKALSKGDNIISSPLIPIHRRELVGDGTGSTAASGVNKYQLLLNYVFGHEDSDLLLLPYGPMVSYINHPPPGKNANAIIQWHQLDKVGVGGDDIPRRQQYHHPELFQLSADVVAEMHGKGLLIDIVALTDIGVAEEIYIDYGSAWAKAWDNHVKRWTPPAGAPTYASADKLFRINGLDKRSVRTVAEQEMDPYPGNVQTVCYYDGDAAVLEVDEEKNIVFTSWITEEDWPHECLRMCIILDRYYDEESKEMLYRAEMLPYEGAYDLCILEGGTHIASDISWDGILIVDKPYTSDVFLEQAFRHEIGVPDGLYPQQWLRQKVRRRPDKQQLAGANKGGEFKRKKKKEVMAKRMKERSPRIEL